MPLLSPMTQVCWGILEWGCRAEFRLSGLRALHSSEDPGL